MRDAGRVLLNHEIGVPALLHGGMRVCAESRDAEAERLERMQKLRNMACSIIDEMDEHQLLGFVLSVKGKKAMPQLTKLWNEVMGQETGPAPADNLVELVVQKPKH